MVAVSNLDCHSAKINYFIFSQAKVIVIEFVTPTDRPKSVRNRCVIGSFKWSFCVVTLLFGVSVDVRAGFCHRTDPDLFLFFFTRFNGYFASLLSYFIRKCYFSVSRSPLQDVK